MLRASLAFCLAASAYGERPPEFPPFDAWRRAVVSGDQKAIEDLYSRRPPARIVHGQTEVSNLSDESKFWSSLKAGGLSAINPKLLSLKVSDGKAQLVIRIDAKAENKNVVGSVAQLWVQQLDGWHIAIAQTLGLRSGVRANTAGIGETQSFPVCAPGPGPFGFAGRVGNREARRKARARGLRRELVL